MGGYSYGRCDQISYAHLLIDLIIGFRRRRGYGNALGLLQVSRSRNRAKFLTGTRRRAERAWVFKPSAPVQSAMRTLLSIAVLMLHEARGPSEPRPSCPALCQGSRCRDIFQMRLWCVLAGQECRLRLCQRAICRRVRPPMAVSAAPVDPSDVNLRTYSGDQFLRMDLYPSCSRSFWIRIAAPSSA